MYRMERKTEYVWYGPNRCRSSSELAGCRAGETQWRIHTSVRYRWRQTCIYSVFSMATEVLLSLTHILGREVAYYVRDRFIDEIKKL